MKIRYLFYDISVFLMHLVVLQGQGATLGNFLQNKHVSCKCFSISNLNYSWKISSISGSTTFGVTNLNHRVISPHKVGQWAFGNTWRCFWLLHMKDGAMNVDTMMTVRYSPGHRTATSTPLTAKKFFIPDVNTIKVEKS